ncbi:hypothetical protein [Aliarcobacter cryaerophilus]|uniref:hypothetical protein n=1 Tax=Aliarcobacter cryaerophilus TaxID=28198 RepID=UPI0021B1DEB8|nr:hypothetical protein [Aliarcobacter cryaerophilus]MCT7469055.1 hypothetical protein [Aliarcobacter cryaerophilus]
MIVVVLNDDGTTPIDTISDKNFVSLREISKNDGIYEITSIKIDHITKQESNYITRFNIKHNKHILEAFPIS